MIHLFIMECIITFNAENLGLIPRLSLRCDLLLHTEYSMGLDIFSFDTCFVGYWIVSVYYLSDCENTFYPKICFVSNQKQIRYYT